MRGYERIAGAFFSLILLLSAGDAPSDKMSDESISSLPNELPPTVKAMVLLAIKVYLDGYADPGDYASGLHLTQGTILTTGHLFDKLPHCDSVVVDSSTNEEHTQPAPTQGTRRWAGTVQKRHDTADVALITLPKITGNPEDMGATAPIKIRDVAIEPMQKGELVYTFGLGQYAFANGESHQRDLYGTSFTPEQLLKGYANPHIIGGVVLQTTGVGVLADRRYVIETGLKDYTQGEKDPEKRLHPGDSGSAVVDGLGRLIGVVAQVNHKSQFTRLPAGYVPLGYVQPVDREIVDDLSKRPVEPCISK